MAWSERPCQRGRLSAQIYKFLSPSQVIDSPGFVIFVMAGALEEGYENAPISLISDQ